MSNFSLRLSAKNGPGQTWELSFLITQAPTDLNDFYSVVESFKPSKIIQVTRFFENNIKKAK